MGVEGPPEQVRRLRGDLGSAPRNCADDNVVPYLGNAPTDIRARASDRRQRRTAPGEAGSPERPADCRTRTATTPP